jgi:WhiB family redox-sensing transcriptional regulator
VIFDVYDNAACKKTEANVFFPKGHNENRYDQAKSICETCTVKGGCLGLVLHLEDFEDKWGVFGGLTPAERKELRRRRERFDKSGT